jgi:hypothetical protein
VSRSETIGQMNRLRKATEKKLGFKRVRGKKVRLHQARNVRNFFVSNYSRPKKERLSNLGFNHDRAVIPNHKKRHLR